MPNRWSMFPLLFVVALAPVAVRADDNADARKAIREAFKPLPLAGLGRLDQQLEPDLPTSIVIESGPFDALVRGLLEPLEESLARREAVVAAHGAESSAPAAFAAGLKTLEKENAEFALRVAAVEAAYDGAWDKGWMDAGTGERRTRQKAAVLIPFHRRLAFRNAAVVDGVAEAFVRVDDEDRRAWLAKAAARDSTDAVRRAAVRALGLLASPEGLETVRKVLRTDKNAAVRYEALAALGRWPRGEVTEDVAAALRDEAWEVRSLAGAFAAAAELPGLADALVDALDGETGRLRTDLDAALGSLFGVRFGGDAALWRRWLGENAEAVAARVKATADRADAPLGPLEDWAGPPGGAPPGADGEGAPAGDGEGDRNRTSSFYGIDTTSRRVLFVVDISRSMLDPSGTRPPTVTGGSDRFASPTGNAKIDVARWQLHRAVDALPDDASFGVVVFSESYKAWQPGMVEASKRNQAAAHAFIDAIPPNGTTNLADPLDEVFDTAGFGPLALPDKKAPPGLAVDTVFFLSDGNPNRGRTSDLGALLESVVDRNLRARIVIHTVGIGEVAGSAFLQDLARRTGGRYVGFK